MSWYMTEIPAFGDVETGKLDISGKPGLHEIVSLKEVYNAQNFPFLLTVSY